MASYLIKIIIKLKMHHPMNPVHFGTCLKTTTAMMKLTLPNVDMTQRIVAKLKVREVLVQTASVASLNIKHAVEWFHYFGDGQCDLGFNNKEHFFDIGDCCQRFYQPPLIHFVKMIIVLSPISSVLKKNLDIESVKVITMDLFAIMI